MHLRAHRPLPRGFKAVRLPFLQCTQVSPLCKCPLFQSMLMSFFSGMFKRSLALTEAFSAARSEPQPTRGLRAQRE